MTKKIKLVFLSISVVFSIFLGVIFSDIVYYEYREIADLRSRIDKYEKLSEAFLELNKPPSSSKLSIKLNEIRNNIFWNSDDNTISNTEVVKYPCIVNEDGKSIENHKHLVPPDLLCEKKSILSIGSQIVLVFPISRFSSYLLVPVRVNNPVNISPISSESNSLAKSYDFSLKWRWNLLRLDLLAQALFWGAFLIFSLYIYKNKIIRTEKSYTRHNYRKVLQRLFDTQKELKVTKFKVYQCQRHLELFNTIILNQAISYVNRYQFLSKILTDISIDNQKTKCTQKSLSIIGIFSKKIMRMEDIIYSTLKIFDESIKNHNIKIVQEHKGKGRVVCDEDFLSSTLIIVLSNIFRSISGPQEVKIYSFSKDGTLVIEISGAFNEAVKGYKYPGFLNVSTSKSKNLIIKRILIPTLVFQDDKSVIKIPHGDNVVPFYNN